MSLQFKNVERAGGRNAIQLVVWRYDTAKKRTLPKAVAGGTIVMDGEILRQHTNPPADLLAALAAAGGGDVERGALVAWWDETRAARAKEQARSAMTGLPFSVRHAASRLAEAEAAQVLDHDKLIEALAEAEALTKALRKAVRATTAPRPIEKVITDAPAPAETSDAAG